MITLYIGIGRGRGCILHCPCRGFVFQIPLLLSRFSLLTLPWLRPPAPVTPVPVLVIVLAVASSPSSCYPCPGSRYCPCRGFIFQIPLLLSRFTLLSLPWLSHPAPVTPVPVLVIVIAVASSSSSRYSCPGLRYCPCRGFVLQLPLLLSRFSLLSLPWLRPPAPVTPVRFTLLSLPWLSHSAPVTLVPVLVIVLAVASSSSSRYPCPGSRYCHCRGFVLQLPLLQSRFLLLSLPWFRPPAPVTLVPVHVIVLAVASSSSSRYSCPGSRYCPCRGFVLQLLLLLSRFSLLSLPWLRPPAPVTPVPVLVIVPAVASSSSSCYPCPGSRYCPCRGFVLQLPLLLSRFSLLSLPWLRPPAPVTPVPVLVIVLAVASSSRSRYSCPGSRYCPCRGFVLQLLLLLSRFSLLSLPWLRPPAPVTLVPVLVIVLAVASSSRSRYSCPGSRYCPCRGFVPLLLLLLSRFSLLSLPWLRPPAPVTPVSALVAPSPMYSLTIKHTNCTVNDWCFK